jgi:hypothetical protein
VGVVVGVLEVVVEPEGVVVVDGVAAACDISPTPTPPDAAAMTNRVCAIRRERSSR